jgi:hypothetical protein
MSYVIYLDTKNKVALRPACVALCPELSGISDEELCFIAAAYDYHSPFRRFNQQDRIRRAMIEAFGDNNPKILKAIEDDDKSHRIMVAIEAYKSLQYDEKEELKQTYRNKVAQLQGEIPTLDGKALENCLKSIDMLNNRIKAIENEIYEDVLKEGQLKGDQQNSYIEILQRNKKNYEIVRNKKPQRV